RPPRPGLVLDLPFTLHGMDRAQRDDIQATLDKVLFRAVGDVHLLNALMRLYDEIECFPEWDRVRVDLAQDGSVRVALRWPADSATGRPEHWVKMGGGMMVDDLLEQARLAGLEMDEDLAEDLETRLDE